MKSKLWQEYLNLPAARFDKWYRSLSEEEKREFKALQEQAREGEAPTGLLKG